VVSRRLSATFLQPRWILGPVRVRGVLVGSQEVDACRCEALKRSQAQLLINSKLLGEYSFERRPRPPRALVELRPLNDHQLVEPELRVDSYALPSIKRQH
jgi:hypothetical protein